MNRMALEKTRPRRARPLVRPLKTKRQAVANIEAELLKRVRIHDGLSRVELARQLGIAPSTAGGCVDRLIAEGFLFEGRKSARELGRPPTLLALNPAGGFFVGVDFEAQNIMATVVDFSQRPIRQLHKTILPTDSVEQIICKLEETIEEVMSNQSRQILGIGIGVPGTIDPKNQIALHYPHIPGWENIPLGERLGKRFRANIFLENNIRSMALAELWFGHGRGLESFVCIGIRAGVGAGIVTRRRVVHGKDNLAGEIGDWLSPIAPAQRKSSSNGAWSCEQLLPLEKIVSVPAILAAVRVAVNKSGSSFLRGKTQITFEDVVQAVQLKDRVVIGVLEKIAQTLGWVVCQINALFNPQKVILAGPLVMLGETFLAPMQNAVKQFCSPRRQGAPEVVGSALGNFNGALGAAALALHEWKPRR